MLQCALNMEQYDIAQQLREKLTEVVIKLHVLNLSVRLVLSKF